MGIKTEIELIKYYMDTIMNKNNDETTYTRSLKLGKHFIRRKS